MSCYTLLRGWTLLVPPPRCLRGRTPFISLSRHLRALTPVSVVPVSERELNPRPRLPGYGPVGFGVGPRGRGKSPLPAGSVALHRRDPPRGWAEAHFGGNQLSPPSMGISPLRRGDRRGWAHHPCGPPRGINPRFTLPRRRSGGFWSCPSDYPPYSDGGPHRGVPRLRPSRFPCGYGGMTPP